MNDAQSETVELPKHVEDGWLAAIQSFAAILPIGVPFPILQAIARLASGHSPSSLVYMVVGLYLLWKLRRRFIYTVVARDASCQKLIDAFVNKPWTTSLRMASVDINIAIPPATTPSLSTSLAYQTSALFWFGWVPLWISVDAYDERKQDLFITISCLFSAEPIRRFLEHYPDIDAQQDIWEVNPYRLDRGYSNPWTRRSRPRRPIDSIATTTEQKAIKEKIWLFFSRGEFYSKKSLPYRQGFFFHGPPGTGKSSMATAVASDFRMSIYVVPLSGLLDTQFQNLISSIPSRCVIVFEDIDAAGLGRKEGSTNKGISLSVFLAALDGIGGGSLIFMTTNHPETIDDAILRPGRVDHRVEFPYASKDQAKQLFRRLLCSDEDNTEDEIEQLVQTFSKGIPEGRLTTAQIEHYLMSHFGNPAAAAENVSEWADKEAAISK